MGELLQEGAAHIRPGGSQTQVQNPTQPLTSCVMTSSLGKSLAPSSASLLAMEVLLACK